MNLQCKLLMQKKHELFKRVSFEELAASSRISATYPIRSLICKDTVNVC